MLPFVPVGEWVAVAVTYALALAAAIGASAVGIPLPWLIGPLLAVAAVRLAGGSVHGARYGRHTGQWVLGTVLGLYFTPAVAREIGSLWPWVVVASAFAVALGYAGARLLARTTGVDFTTAYFSAAIGGAAEMANLAERHGARVDRVAAAHSLRLVLVVIIVPALFAWSGVHGVDAYVPAVRMVHYGGLALLALVTLGGALTMRWIDVPNAWVLGPMAVTIALTANDVAWTAVPRPLVNAAQLLIGCSLGQRFTREFFRAAPRYLAAIAVYTLGALVCAALFGLFLGAAAGMPAPTALLATTPGGIAEMCVTAQVLQLGVPVVTTFQVARLAVVVIVTEPLFRRLERPPG